MPRHALPHRIWHHCVEKLVKKISPYGYEPMKCIPGLWSHKTHKTTFTLCVDNFGVKYFSKYDTHHLIKAVKNYYDVTLDWEGKLYCGINLKWNY